MMLGIAIINPADAASEIVGLGMLGERVDWWRGLQMVYSLFGAPMMALSGDVAAPGQITAEAIPPQPKVPANVAMLILMLGRR